MVKENRVVTKSQARLIVLAVNRQPLMHRDVRMPRSAGIARERLMHRDVRMPRSAGIARERPTVNVSK